MNNTFNKDGTTRGFISDTAYVSDSAYIGPSAQVTGYAWVLGNAQVYDEARVFDQTYVFGNAQIHGNTHIFGCARLGDNTNLFGDSSISGLAPSVTEHTPLSDRILCDSPNGSTKRLTEDQKYKVEQAAKRDLEMIIEYANQYTTIKFEWYQLPIIYRYFYQLHLNAATR